MAGLLGSDSTASSYTVTTNNIWTTWVQQTTTSTATNIIWDTWWEEQLSNHRHSQSYQTIFEAPRVPTAAEVAAEETRIARQRAELQEAARQRASAERRAEEILLEHLTPAQREDYRKNHGFEVCVKSRRYRINRGIAGNILQLNEKGVAIARFCAHVPHGSVPEPDNHLTQLMMLRHHEGDFLRVANRHPLV